MNNKIDPILLSSCEKRYGSINMKRKKLSKPAPDLITTYLPDDPILAQVWFDCLRWSVTEPEMLAAFHVDTGCDSMSGLTPIDRVIDEATGNERAFVEQYVA
jgi:hypothetical protein